MAQFGSALPWGGRGRGFKSRHSDHVGASFVSLAPIFYKNQSALTPLLLLPPQSRRLCGDPQYKLHVACGSFPNRTRSRWASIRFFILIGVSFFVNASRVVADCVSFATAFFISKQTPSLIHSVAPPPPAKPAALQGPQI